MIISQNACNFALILCDHCMSELKLYITALLANLQLVFQFLKQSRDYLLPLPQKDGNVKPCWPSSIAKISKSHTKVRFQLIVGSKVLRD